MADIRGMGNALAGMGAGFMGRGAEWRYYQDRAAQEAAEFEQQRQSLYEQNAMGNMSALYEHLQNSQHIPALNTMYQSLQDAIDFGDEDDALQMQALIREFENGSMETVRGMVNSAVTGAVGAGRMPAPPSLAARMEEDKIRREESIKAEYRGDPDRIQMWEYLKSLPPEEREAFRTMAGQGVTVNTGLPKLPAGYQWNEAGDGVEPIPGGPQDPDNPANKRKSTGRASMIRRAGTTVVQDLGRADELIPDLINLEGMAGANARAAKGAIKGSPEWRFMKHINSAKSNIGLDRLQQMRENSPTGGALGQVPFQQQKRLEQVYGEVDLGMEISEIQDNIKRIQNIYTDIMYGDPTERALAVEEGRMTQEESDAVDSLYRDVSFDIMGVSEESPDSAYERWKKENNL